MNETRRAREKRQAENIIQNIAIPNGLTKSQEATLLQVIRNIPYFDFYNSDDYEMKEMSINVDEGIGAYVGFTTGMKGDEGTAASILCRKRRFFRIGKRGGIYIWNSKNNSISCTLFNLMNREYEH